MIGLKAVAPFLLGILTFFPLQLLAAGVPGTKERISFEGLVGKHDQSPIPDYDGFGWSSSMEAVGRGLYKDQQGFQSVVRRKVAAVFFSGTGVDGIIRRDDASTFSFRSGHFAAFGNSAALVTFEAYREGTLVGSMELTLEPTDTLIQFDSTFAHIDEFVIQGQSVAMDDLHVSF